MSSNLLFTLLATVIFLVSTGSNAMGKGAGKKATVVDKKSTDPTELLKEALVPSSEATALETRKYEEGLCQKLADDYNSAVNACSDKCQKNVEACKDGPADTPTEKVEVDTIDLILQGTGITAANSKDSKDKGSDKKVTYHTGGYCEMTPDEIKSRKDSADRDGKDLNDKIAKTEEELVKLNTDLADQLSDIEKTIATEKEKFQEAQLIQNREMREQSERIQTVRNTVKDEIRRLLTNKASFRKELNQRYYKIKQEMIAYSDATIVRTCTLKAKELKKSTYEKNTVSGGISAATSSGNSKKKDIEAMYNDCLSAGKQARANLLEQYQDETADTNKKITDTDEQLNEKEQQLATQVANQEAAYNDLKVKMSQTEQNYQEAQLRHQKEYNNAMLSKQQNEARLNKQLADLKQQLYTNKLVQTEFGVKPKTADKDTTLSASIEKYNKHESIANEARDSRCCTGTRKYSFCSSTGLEKSSPSKSEATK